MMEFHPLADLFPLMQGGEYADLVADIQANGLIEEITLHEGKILDGRNRYRACIDAGRDPLFCEFKRIHGPADGDPLSFVVARNLKRRHLSPSQLAVVALDIEKIEAKRAKERQGARTDIVEQIPQSDAGRAREKAAKAVGTNERYVSDAKKIAQVAPDALEDIRAGTKTITQVKRDLKEQRRESRRQENREKVAAAPAPDKISDAKFATIVIDPPWDWGDEGDQDQLGRARPDYHTASLSELLELPVPKYADDDCHLYLWITNRSLPKGFQLLERWGFRYITCLTWVKPHFGMGNYFRGQTEHVLFGVRGSQALKRKDLGTVFQAKRGPNHSSKPVEFYDLVESASPGPYLEMYSRHDRPDWTAWGEDSRDAA